MIFYKMKFHRKGAKDAKKNSVGQKQLSIPLRSLRLCGELICFRVTA
jgi:hypothetical protein